MGSDTASGGEEFPTVEGFEILEELGGGGMGTVYRAIQLEFDRQVALKLINRQLARDPEFRRRFEEEMRVAATLQHPNIVPVYAAGGSGRDLYMAMMLVPGEDLATLVSRDGPMRPAVAVAVIEQIASALDEAHGQRLIHRDVKPQNVIIDARNSHAYLTDFGLARSLDATTGITATGHQMGTLDYMAPEQLSGGAVDHRTDIYALGCLLYSIVSGERPFTGDSLGAVVRQKLDGPSQPTLADRGFDLGLSQVVQKAQADDPASRYDSAGEMAQAALSSLGPSATAQTGTAFSPVRTQPMHRRASDPRQRPTARVPDDPPDRARIWRRVALGALAAIVIAGVGAAAILAATSGSGGSNDSADAANSSQTTAEATTSTVTDTTSASTGSSKYDVLGTWSGPAQITYDDGQTDPFTQTVSINSLAEDQPAGTSTAVQGNSTCTGPMTLLSIRGTSYRFSYQETNTDECIDTSVLTLRLKGSRLDYRERTEASISTGTLLRTAGGGGQKASAGEGGATDGWPDNQAGWAVILSSNTVRSNAEELAASESGGVLYSSDYPDLTPGYWVVFIGPFSSESDARAALPAYTDSHPDAYVRYIDGSDV